MGSLSIGLPPSSARILQGDHCTTLRDFYGHLAELVEYPDDFGFTLEEVDDLLSDLSWLPDRSIHIHISNSEYWLQKERNQQKIFTILDLLEAIAEDWKWTDESDEDAKILQISFSDSPRIRELFELAGIHGES